MDTTFRPQFLKDKVTIITGGATGICYGIAEAFLKYGAKVFITSRKKEVLENSCKKLAESTGNPNISFSVCDVRDYQQVEAMVQQVLDKFSRIDILINGAAGNFLVPFEKMSANAYKTVHEIDNFGTFYCCKAVVSKFFLKNGGVIINISATLHYNGVALQAHAGSAKAAIDALTRHLSVELGPKNIRVVGIAPGPIGNTEGFKKLSGDQNETSIEEMLPLQRLGKSEDIAAWALFLASPAASFFTGQTVVVDGGQINAFPNFTLLSKQVRDMLKSKL